MLALLPALACFFGVIALGPGRLQRVPQVLVCLVLANLVFLPMVGKLKVRSKEEILIMEMQMEGVLGISRGENPRIIMEKLTSFQPPKDRRQMD